MDLSVALIKVRDYLFWFGPAYLLALALAGALEVMLRRRLHLPPRQSAPRREARARTPAARRGAPATPAAPDGHSGPAAGGLKTSEASGDDPKGDPGPESGLLAEVWWHRAGRPLPGWAPLSLFVWLGVLDRSVTLTALLMTAALSWPLAVLRLGLALVFASLVAVLVPVLVPVRGASGRSVNVSLARGPVRPPGSIWGEWWQAVRERLDRTSNALLIGVGLGGAAFGAQKDLLAALGLELAPPLSYLWWALLGAVMPLVPGTELPVLVALQVRGADTGVLAAFMLGVTAGGWRLFGALRSRVGLSTAVAYLALASALAALAAWLVAPLIRGGGVF
jgi:hypothetical protein